MTRWRRAKVGRAQRPPARIGRRREVQTNETNWNREREKKGLLTTDDTDEHGYFTGGNERRSRTGLSDFFISVCFFKLFEFNFCLHPYRFTNRVKSFTKVKIFEIFFACDEDDRSKKLREGDSLTSHKRLSFCGALPNGRSCR